MFKTDYLSETEKQSSLNQMILRFQKQTLQHQQTKIKKEKCSRF